MKNKLTHREEEVMRILWKLEKGFVKDIIEEMGDPKPPYNTISSLVRKLEGLNYIGHESFGKTHRYYPILKKEEYRKSSLKTMMNNYFGGSVEQLMSYFVKEENVNLEELNEILDKIKEKK